MAFNRAKDFEKRAISICIILVALLYSFLCGCSCSKNGQKVEKIEGFSVNFIDVGNGDCIFIRFDDGKNMLIDSGYSSDDNLKNIRSVLDIYDTTKIDYLVLTHPDADHVGNVDKLLSNYSVKRAYLPKIDNLAVFAKFQLAHNSLVNHGAQITYSSMYESICGDNYFVAFLSPCFSNVGDYYGHFNGLSQPTERDINDLSPIIYLEYKGFRFLFTGDASVRQERMVLENYYSAFYTYAYEREIDLYDIDVLKVAHHGSEDSSGLDFLSVLRPKNAVFSVNGDNVYGHPSVTVLSRLYEVNPSVQVLRTDVLGNITFSVDLNGKLNTNN